MLIIPTGEEIVPRGVEPQPGQMNESNGVMNYLYVKRYGGDARRPRHRGGRQGKAGRGSREAAAYDLIVTTGGSSVGKRDLLPEVVSSMGKVLVHGVAIKPGKPVAMGYVDAGGTTHAHRLSARLPGGLRHRLHGLRRPGREKAGPPAPGEVSAAKRPC